MTREEAIKILEENKPTVIFEDEDVQKRMADIWNALDVAIKALEQESVLDKIRAEIKKMPTDYCGGYVGLDKQEVMQIIDKYKAESEVNDNEKIHI